eukprot:TRINITY_DN2501_c0_g1_i4.p1 TRINITY_DN2501_c0_g1~~TRINITY_DN2501_c0_g1_i4.p1  ORF type:complete len:231 (+),score=36.17 TRINITY_DN2501_c0_g1_i4:448-1140(+)
MVPVGGTPCYRYAFDEESVCVTAQMALAKQYGLLFDVLPFQITDFNGNLPCAAVGIGAVLLAKLRSRDRGLCRVDAVLFGSKGTQATALALHQYWHECGDNFVAPTLLAGFGTDLANFRDSSAGALRLPPEQLARRTRFLVVNSAQDGSVSPGLPALAAFVAQARSDAVVFDVGAHLHDWYSSAVATNPSHHWYGLAFRDDCAYGVLAPLLLQHLSAFVHRPFVATLPSL